MGKVWGGEGGARCMGGGGARCGEEREGHGVGRVSIGTPCVWSPGH